MEASPSWFEKNGYTLDAVLNHQQLVPFIKTYIFKRNIFTLGYLISNLLFLIALLASILFQFFNETMTMSKAFESFAYGCALTFALVPLHEGIHGVAYKLCGAPVVTFAANWKKLYFMAIADKFVTRRYPFYFIGLAPFLMISLTFLILSLFYSGGQQIMFLTVLLFHASMCAGDFGLLSYFAEQGNKEVVTFDDHKNSLTYFYVKS